MNRSVPTDPIQSPFADGTDGGPALEFSAKQATELVGVTVRTLRHYQQLGLLPEPRRTTKGLVYTSAHVLKLLQIKRFTTMGLSLDEVAQLISESAGTASQLILRELDQALADRVAEIQSQRRVIHECLQANSPIDILPAFARHVAALRRIGGPRAEQANAVLVDLVVGCGDQRHISELLALVEQITSDPLTARLADLEGRLRSLNEQSAEAEVADLAMNYGRLLTDLFQDYVGRTSYTHGRWSWGSTDLLVQNLLDSVANERQREVLMRAVTVLAAHAARDA